MISLIMLKKIESDIIKLMNKWRNDGQVVGLNNPEGDAEKKFLLFLEQYARSCRNIAWRL